jgi:hypothetical protein
MIAWQLPAAFWGLLLLAVPIIIHILRRHRADRVPFPSLRFVRPAPTSAVRVRTPSDLLLLCLRMAIVALAVCAAAGPVLLTRSRVDAWNAQVARAVVVDTSESMRMADDGVVSATAAADAELRTATYGRRVDAADLAAGLRRATSWLASTPPARREVVVISDFQHGSLGDDALTRVPGLVGLRLVQVGQPVEKRALTGVPLLGAGHVGPRMQAIELTEATGLVLTTSEAAGNSGLRCVHAPEQQGEVDAMLRALAVAGTPGLAPGVNQPIAIRFAGQKPAVTSTGTLSGVSAGWMLQTVLRLQQDEALQRSAASVDALPMTGSQPWFVIARDKTAQPLVRAAASGDELVMEIAASPGSYFSAAAVRAALVARRGAVDRPEQEILRSTQAELAAWTRPSGAVDRGAWRNVQSSDARWLWLGVLLLLGVEQWLRAREPRTLRQEVSRAAA